MGLRRFASLALQEGLTTRETFTLYPPSRAIVRPHAAAVDTDLLDAARGGALSRDSLLRILRHADLPDLLLAAAHRRSASLDAPDATYGTDGTAWVDSAPGAAPASGAFVSVAFGAGESDSALLDHLLALASQPILRVVRFQGVPNAGAAVPEHDNTATRWLRVTALARLLFPLSVRVAGDWERYGRGLGQVALRAGAEDYGAIREVDDGEMVDGVWPMSAREAERILRMTGLRPLRRDGEFAPVGEAVTRAEDRRRPLRRLDRPNA
jgi:cyclic dehypoxanthinyl futalosine synthase